MRKNVQLTLHKPRASDDTHFVYPAYVNSRMCLDVSYTYSLFFGSEICFYIIFCCTWTSSDIDETPPSTNGRIKGKAIGEVSQVFLGVPFLDFPLEMPLQRDIKLQQV